MRAPEDAPPAAAAGPVGPDNPPLAVLPSPRRGPRSTTMKVEALTTSMVWLRQPRTLFPQAPHLPSPLACHLGAIARSDGTILFRLQPRSLSPQLNTSIEALVLHVKWSPDPGLAVVSLDFSPHGHELLILTVSGRLFLLAVGRVLRHRANNPGAFSSIITRDTIDPQSKDEVREVRVDPTGGAGSANAACCALWWRSLLGRDFAVVGGIDGSVSFVSLVGPHSQSVVRVKNAQVSVVVFASVVVQSLSTCPLCALFVSFPAPCTSARVVNACSC